MDTTQDLLDRVNDNTLYNTIGIRIEQVGDGKATSRLEPNPKLCWPSPDQPHGGVLFTLMDTTMAWAVLSDRGQSYGCSTINSDIQYTLPAKGKRFVCSAWITQRTRRMSFVRAEIHDSGSKLVAVGQATFRIIKTDVMGS